MKEKEVLDSILRQMEKLKPPADPKYGICYIQEQIVILPYCNILNKKSVLFMLSAIDIRNGLTNKSWSELADVISKFVLDPENYRKDKKNAKNTKNTLWN